MTDTQIITKPKIEIQPLKMFDVIFFNDDYTPMDFVIKLLTDVFNYSISDATSITMKVHNNGFTTVGTFTYEVAETKKDVCVYNADQHQYPLRVEISESSSSI